MFPVLLEFNSAYCFPVKTVFFCYHGILSFVFSYLKNLFFGKLGHAVFFAFHCAQSASALFNHIGHVVRIISKKQMIWIYAGRSVAFMQNVEIVFYFTKMKFPRCSVRPRSFFALKEKVSISLSAVFCPGPKPTRFSLINMAKKSIFYFAEAVHGL